VLVEDSSLIVVVSEDVSSLIVVVSVDISSLSVVASVDISVVVSVALLEKKKVHIRKLKNIFVTTTLLIENWFYSVLKKEERIPAIHL
jgi:hypothetical protein